MGLGRPREAAVRRPVPGGFRLEGRTAGRCRRAAAMGERAENLMSYELHSFVDARTRTPG
jgi:hypothetical protein